MRVERIGWMGALAGLVMAGAVLAEEAPQAGKPARAAKEAREAKEAPGGVATATRLVRNGVVVDFEVTPVGTKELMADWPATVRFRITSEATGEPVRSASPGAWIDMGRVLEGQAGAAQKSCKEKVTLYMQGAVGIRPIIDMNSYYVLLMNAEPNLVVVDPLVSMVGRTSTLGTIPLPGVASDWAKSTDQKRLFVSVPLAGKVVVVDVEAFKAGKQIDVGVDPVRVAIQPDGKYVWVGTNGTGPGEGGVAVVDTETEQKVAHIPTGPGHHDIAFSEDSRYAFVTNRLGGTVSVIDVATRKPVKDIQTGSQPISIGYSALSGAAYVSDGKDGTVTVIDGKTHEKLATIAARPGLGPLRFAPDGRHALVANGQQDAVYVIDAATNELVNTIKIAGEPYQIVFSQTFAYVRSMRSERVSMIAVRTLGRGYTPTVQSFAAGAQPPRVGGGQIAIADSIAAASAEAAAVVVNPADNTAYYYMEGMNAPSTNYQVRGSSARAVTMVDHNLKEEQPGVYTGTIKLPSAGRYDVAFMMQNPQLLHCFSMDAVADPAAPKRGLPILVKYEDERREVKAGETYKLRFSLVDAATGRPRTGVADARVMYTLAGRLRTEVAVRERGDGVYEADLPMASVGAYYIYIGVPSMSLEYGKLPFISVRALEPVKEAKPAAR